MVVMMEAAKRRNARNHNSLAWHAYTSAVLQRQKKLSRADYDKLLVRNAERRVMTTDEIRAQLRAMAATYKRLN